MFQFHFLKQAYKQAVKEFKTKNPDAALGYTTDAWWETAEFKKLVESRKRNDAAKETLVGDKDKLTGDNPATGDEKKLEDQDEKVME